MFRDFKELLECFRDHNVKYLIVGGYAVSFHSQPRATKDLDLFVQSDAENANAIFEALAAFGASLANVTPSDFMDRGKFIRFGREPMAVDILSTIDGVKFDEAWARRIEVVIEPTTGLKAFFISRSDLIASKVAAGRMRDLADVEEIRNAAAKEEPGG
ncbi:MAG TPA: nucleotidyl transferase AbiEii/AbiGii toxin family protein [Candidatus Acidoferrales bacterium]|nr:nucleotidyl transferase AbiEii/AbiGii toxin family protein [Candidatus Acidoferrales bacterium]